MGDPQGNERRGVDGRSSIRGSFAVPFANVTPFRDGLMAGESVYFGLATLCEQAVLPLDAVRVAARRRAEASASAVSG